MAIEAYLPRHEDAVARFNHRLAQGGSPFRFPATSRIPWLPRDPGRDTFLEGHVAIDGDEVRGGYMVKHQPFALQGEPCDDIRNLQLPLSEGSIDSAYAQVGVELLSTAARRNRRMYALGMGGTHTPLPTVLRSMGWTVSLVPFHFHVMRAGPFLRNIRVLRTSRARRLLLDAAAASGLAVPVLAVAQRRGRGRNGARARAEVVTSFGDWADAIWEGVRGHYALLALRDAAELNTLYPPDAPKPIRLKVSLDGRAVGWALLFDSALRGHKQFGDMRLGTLVDCLALPGHEGDVVLAAREHLRAAGVDLVVSNQQHAAWCTALHAHGFLRGPSNYALAVSRGLRAALEPWATTAARIHMTRGDGDGPIHL
ncbi:hypothetical protein [Luteimonas sp. MC1895]|uniref:hypothetical protein n=1 Tax=Luteimonas sp. MC1895 TaxID=2819513 RepID=UPI0018F06773|nr:hypothetical protein [Luteimonas sp. MC1895]MBJ6978233.1 hypothetical protein [Luteimonas sp. MC1895]